MPYNRFHLLERREEEAGKTLKYMKKRRVLMHAPGRIGSDCQGEKPCAAGSKANTAGWVSVTASPVSGWTKESETALSW